MAVEIISFACKKWTLFTLCLIGISITLVFIVVACNIIDESEPAPGSTEEEAKNWSVTQVINNQLIFILKFNLVDLEYS